MIEGEENGVQYYYTDENKRKEFEQKIEKNFKLMRMEYCM